MTHDIGKIINHKGVLLKVEQEGNDWCCGCYFDGTCDSIQLRRKKDITGECCEDLTSDGKGRIFVEI